MKAIDLFAGCGGLSLGLEMAGATPLAAIERSPMAGETHFRNFHLRGLAWDQGAWESEVLGQPFRKQAEGGTIVGDILEVVADEEVMDHFAAEEPDLVVGGPPCQGFSMAGRRDPTDIRNRLPWAFLDFVEVTRPRGVIIENVVGINRVFRNAGQAGDSPFDQLRQALGQIGPGYLVQPIEVNAKHFGVPQNRPRMMLVAVRADVAAGLGLRAGLDVGLWRSRDAATCLQDGTRAQSPTPLVPRVTHHQGSYLTVADALVDIDEDGYAWPPRDQRYRRKRAAYARLMRQHPLQAPQVEIQNHSHRRHSERVTDRFELYHAMRDLGLPNSLMGIAYTCSDREAEQQLMEIVNPAGKGRNKTASGRDVVQEVIRLKTKKHSQRAIHAGEPAPTVVTLPDDYVHPKSPRIMTVRELARFQSFPDWFEFRSKETTGSDRRKTEVPQFSQVGNAVPPLLAKAVATALIDAINEADRG